MCVHICVYVCVYMNLCLGVLLGSCVNMLYSSQVGMGVDVPSGLSFSVEQKPFPSPSTLSHTKKTWERGMSSHSFHSCVLKALQTECLSCRVVKAVAFSGERCPCVLAHGSAG